MGGRFDPKANDLARTNDVTGLFRYLGPMWIKTCMEILEDLLARGVFYPNSGRYQDQLRSAGIYVERMEVAMSAALHKSARNISWEKFQEMYSEKLGKLPDQQQREIKEFWLAGPAPGLVDGTAPIEPSIANLPFDHYVDLFS